MYIHACFVCVCVCVCRSMYISTYTNTIYIHILCACVFDFMVFVAAGGADLAPLVTTVVMLSLTSLGTAFATICVFTPEVFPTPVRYAPVIVVKYWLKEPDHLA